MQRYDEKLQFPRKMPDYCRSCCDRVKDLRQSKGRGAEIVVRTSYGLGSDSGSLAIIGSNS